jgi:hypothetical protein
MSGAPLVRIWWDIDVQGYKIMSPYIEPLVKFLKANIPVSDIQLDDRTNTWTFHERQLPVIQAYLDFLKIKPNLTTRQQAEANARRAGANSSSSKSAIDLAILEFYKLIPFNAALRAYREAQMSVHPDKGGDPDVAARLNAAWDRMKREVYKIS